MVVLRLYHTGRGHRHGRGQHRRQRPDAQRRDDPGFRRQRRNPEPEWPDHHERCGPQGGREYRPYASSTGRVDRLRPAERGHLWDRGKDSYVGLVR